MTNNEMLPEKYVRLRRRAEERIKQWSNFVAHRPTDLHRVIHELKIHLAEQEIKNEELRQLMNERNEKDEVRYESVRNMFWPLS